MTRFLPNILGKEGSDIVPIINVLNFTDESSSVRIYESPTRTANFNIRREKGMLWHSSILQQAADDLVTSFGTYGGGGAWVMADGLHGAFVKLTMPIDCILYDFSVKVDTNTVAAGKSKVFTIIKNISATTLACTLGFGVLSYTDSVHEVSFSAGDQISIRLSSVGGLSGSFTNPTITVKVK